MASIWSSAAMAAAAVSSSPVRSTTVMRSSASCTRTAITSTWRRSCSSSAAKVSRSGRGASSAKATRHVVLGPLVARVREDLLRAVELDEHPRAGVARLVHLRGEERRHVAHPGGLLHVVGDDHDRVLVLDLVHQVLDAGRGDGVE